MEATEGSSELSRTQSVKDDPNVSPGKCFYLPRLNTRQKQEPTEPRVRLWFTGSAQDLKIKPDHEEKELRPHPATTSTTFRFVCDVHQKEKERKKKRSLSRLTDANAEGWGRGQNEGGGKSSFFFFKAR